MLQAVELLFKLSTSTSLCWGFDDNQGCLKVLPEQIYKKIQISGHQKDPRPIIVAEA
jgi:hypothetical protein